MTAANGPVGIATGLRVPIADPCLDEMLRAIVSHARRRAQTDGFGSAIEATKCYERQDNCLYDEVMGRVIGEQQVERQFAPLLLEAVREHRDWLHLTHGFRDLADHARQHRERDADLYSAAASVRSKVAQGHATGIVFDPPMVPAIVSGRRTVVWMPVEFNSTGKCIQAPYMVNGGEGGTYALLVPLNTSRGEYETVPGHRLRIVGVRMGRFGDVTDDEARLLGLEDRVDFLTRWWDRHGEYFFEWRVWRYEVEPVEL